MGIGSKIKEYRNKAGLTQKDLADELHITYQAVSRWENDDAEPSFEMLKDICRILNCSTDDLFEFSKPQEENDEVQEQLREEPVVKEKEQKPILGVCEQCNKSICDADDLFKYNESISVGSGKNSRIESRQRILCKECYEIQLLQDKRIEEQQIRETRHQIIKKRIHSFIWPSLLAVFFLVMSIVGYTQGETSVGTGGLVLAIFGYTFLATMILNNTFIPTLWLDIASWGFLKMPGIIFSFSFGGLIFLIVMKIVLFVLGMLLALISVILATIIAMGLSIFVYPVALIRNIKNKESNYD